MWSQAVPLEPLTVLVTAYSLNFYFLIQPAIQGFTIQNLTQLLQQPCVDSFTTRQGIRKTFGNSPMLKIKFLVTLAAITLLLTGNPVSAQTTQEGLSLGPSTRPFASNDGIFHGSELYEYDAQLWAPYDVTSVDGKTAVKSGFYTQTGAAYLSMNGPAPVPGEDPRDFESVNGWGTGIVLEAGYVSEKGAGWSANFLGLGHGHYLADSEFKFTQVFGGWRQPMYLRSTYNNVSINRQFRQSLSNGGFIEPYVGVRYQGFFDETNQDWPALLVAATPVRFSQKTRNNMAGGHLGTRYFRNYGRYRVGSNIGVGAMYNDITYSAATLFGNAPDGPPARTITNRANGFVPIFDCGAEISYMITRDISMRFGMELHWSWQGVARVDTRQMDLNPYSDVNLTGAPIPISVNTDDVLVAGFSFGIDWNR